MDNMPDFDLKTPAGKQEFRAWLTTIIRNEVNSYSRQVLAQSNTAESVAGGKLKINVTS